ncbi:MAG: hypothetical protein ACXVQ7_07105 [Actinomycetota bacterium]
MQPTGSGGATVIAFGPKRRAARADTVRRRFARAIVSVWIAVGALGVFLLLGEGASLVLRHGMEGLGIALGVLGLAAWPLAGRWVRAATPPASRIRPISSQRSRRPLKRIPISAEATDGDR